MLTRCKKDALFIGHSVHMSLATEKSNKLANFSWLEKIGRFMKRMTTYWLKAMIREGIL